MKKREKTWCAFILNVEDIYIYIIYPQYIMHTYVEPLENSFLVMNIVA